MSWTPERVECVLARELGVHLALEEASALAERMLEMESALDRMRRLPLEDTDPGSSSWEHLPE